jgi:hypothetical protein
MFHGSAGLNPSRAKDAQVLIISGTKKNIGYNNFASFQFFFIAVVV